MVEREHTRFSRVAIECRQIPGDPPNRSFKRRKRGARRPRLAAASPRFAGLSGFVLVGLPGTPAVEAKPPLDRYVACTASSALNDRAVRRGGQVRVIGRGVGREFELTVIAIVSHACRRSNHATPLKRPLESVERRFVVAGNPQSDAARNRPASPAWVQGPPALPAFSLTGRRLARLGARLIRTPPRLRGGARWVRRRHKIAMMNAHIRSHHGRGEAWGLAVVARSRSLRCSSWS
jgi:hypothetical protein